MRLSLCLISMLTLSTASWASSNVYYKWIDSNGLTHYGKKPPVETDSQKVKVQTGHSEPTLYGGVKPDQEQDTENPNTADSEQPLRDPETCTRAQKNLTVLNGRPRIRFTDDQGVLRYLTIDEINESRGKMLKLIQEHC